MIDLAEQASMIDRARALCKKAHAGQTDKGGQPYYLHPFAVADALEGTDEKVVAYLHDVVEDTSYTLDDLKDLGFSESVVNAIAAMTHRREESYEDYVSRLAKNPLARTVKIADLKHNLDPSRPNTPSAKRELYEEALTYLQRLS